MLLLLVEMQANHALKLPFRAAEQTPPSVRLRLTANRAAHIVAEISLSNHFERKPLTPAERTAPHTPRNPGPGESGVGGSDIRCPDAGQRLIPG